MGQGRITQEEHPLFPPPTHNDWEPHHTSDVMVVLLHDDCIPEVRAVTKGKYQVAVGLGMD